MASITKDELKSRVTQPSSRLAVPGAKVEEPARPVETTLSAAKNRVSDFTKKAGKKSGLSPDIVNVDAKEYRPEDLRKAMFSKARTYCSMPDALKPIAQQGFVKAYSAYESAKNDPMSPLYNPYSRPTNYKAIDGLAQYGYDVTKMTEDEIRALTAYRRTTATGYGAAAPTKSSSAAENAAYWAQEYLDASERTAAAESELAAMQKAVDYYVNTLGLSDAEIVQRINTSKDYPTLAKMRETSVTPQLMNRAIDYSGDDTVYGMIFSARNGGASMGSNDMNAGAYMGGFGNRYEDDGGVARRNAGDLNTYNPYAGGTTLEALGLKYGTGSFTAEWLAENRDRLAVEVPDDLKKIDAAIATSTEAEKEYAALQEWAQKRIAAGDTPEEIKEKLDEELGDKDYSTLAKMEEGRRTGNPIAMGYGVGFARSEFERYIDSLYAEANAEAQAETAPQFTVSSYYERGGDGNILNNEVSKWLTGLEQTTKEGEAFIKEYGWLLSGYTQDRGTETLYDRRLVERPGLFGKATGLGETAHALLVEAQKAADNGWLSTVDYVTVAMSVAQNMEAAAAAGMSLEDYLASGMGTLPDISGAIEQGRAEVEQREADRKAMEAMQIQQSIEEADAAVANGTATAEQASLAASLDSMDVSEAEAMSPAIAEQRSAMRAELQEYSRSAIVGNLETVYGDMSTYGGSVREMEAADNARSVAYNTADNIADIALSYYNADANRAAVMGIDLDEYYALYPERRMSTEEAYRRAQTEYNTTWGTVWANVEKQANLARQGQMVMPQQSLSGVVSASEQADAAYDASKAPAIEYGEGVGVGQTIRSSLAGGGLEAAGGTISAIQYFVTSNNDYMAESAARMGFNNDPVAYRKYLEETVAAIADPDQRDAYEYLLKNYEGDVFNITLDAYDIAASNALYRIQQESMEIDQFMQENGTAGENAAFNFGKNAVSNSIYWAETAALTAVGLPGGVAAAVAFGAPAGADMGRKLEAAGMDTNAAKGAALGWVAITGWLEASTIGNYFPGLAEKAGTSLVKQGLSAAFKRNPKILSAALNWIVPSMASEAAQEGVEYLAGTAYESVFTTAAKGGGSFVEYVGQVVQDVEGDELLDSMKMGALMAPVLGVVGLGANAAVKATTAVAGRIPGKRRSQEIAEQIIDNGGATAEQAMEFAEALDEDMKDPEFAAEMQAAAREAMTAEETVSAMLRNSLQDGELGRIAKQRADARSRVSEAEKRVTEAESQATQYAELLQQGTDEYMQNPADEQNHKYVVEMTQAVAQAKADAMKARESLAAAQKAAEGFEVEFGQYQQQILEQSRREARKNVAQVTASEAQQAQMSEERKERRQDTLQAAQSNMFEVDPDAPAFTGTPMQERNERSIRENRKMKPYAEERADSMEFFSFAAELLLEDISRSTRGERIRLGNERPVGGADIEWTGVKRKTTPEIASLLDGDKFTWAKLTDIVTAYVNKDMEYISKHRADAKKLELVLDQMLSDGYTSLDGERMDEYPGYRDFMGYEAKSKTEWPEDVPLPFYHGKSKAAQAAEQAAKSTGESRVDSPVRVMEDLTRELNFGQYTGPRGSEARFSMFSEYMQTDVMHTADYWRKAHEVGHGLSKKLGMTATPEMVNGGVFHNTPQEAFAEFVGVYMADRNTAVQFAGEAFVREFESKMRAAGVYNAVNKTATQMRAYISASAEQKVSASIVNRSDTKRKDSERLRRAITMHIDHAFAGRKVDAMAGNPEYGLEDSMHYREYHKRLAELCLKDRLVDWNGAAMGESFSAMLENNGITADNVDDLVVYKLALHGLDRAAAGKPVFGEGVTEADLQEIVTNASEVVKEASTAWDMWWDKFVSGWLVASGVVTREDYETWRAQYEHYVPTIRDMGGKSLIMQRDAARGWTFHEAKGSDLDVINPLDSVVEYVGSIVTRVAQNTVAQKFDELYQQTEGMGIFAKAVPVPEGNADTTAVDALGGDIYTLSQSPDVIIVSRADGTRVAYQFTDELLLNALKSNGAKPATGILKAAQVITRNMSAIVTSADPTFGVKNAMRDEAKAVTYGSFAATEIDGGAKWAQGFANVVRNSATMQEYENLGGGGWNRIDTGSGKGRAEIRSELIKGYKGETKAEQAYLFGKNVLNALTMEKLNEVLEQTTRVTEFDSARNRVLREQGVEGKRKAFLESQDVTLDFARYGLADSYSQLKAVIPFYGPSVQSLYQQADTIATAFGKDVPEADRKQAVGRIVKTATTYGLRAALQIALTRMLFNDEEREGYAMLADDIKGQNLILPTRLLKEPLVAMGVFDEAEAERMFIRIPTAQGILDNTLYAGFLASMANLTDVDEASVNFLDVANRVMLGALPVDLSGFATDWQTGVSGIFSSSILAVPAAIATNRNWYGSPIVSESMEDLPKIYQYNETTPTLFVEMSKAFGGKVSPLVLQYIAEQYTGFYGKIVIPFLSRDQASGKWNADTAIGNVVRKAVSGYTIEPLYSNDISGAYYDNRDTITGLVETPEGFALPGVRASADMDDARDAAEELQEYYTDLNTELKALTKEINEYNADASMTRAERAMAVREPAAERLRLMEEANAKYDEYMAEYGELSLWERWMQQLQ